MKVSVKQLQEMVKKAVHSKLNEGSDFSALRNIDAQAKTASMEIEKTIIHELGLQHPDQMQDALQHRYLEIAHIMQQKIVEAVKEAASKLSSFPRTEEK